MKLIKEFKIVLIIAGIIGVLILFKAVKKGEFTVAPDEAIESMISRSNIMTSDQLKNGNDKVVVLNLDKGSSDQKYERFNVLTIRFEELTEKRILKTLNEKGFSVVIASKNIATAAKAWILLNQMGIKNLFIADSEDDEVFKYKFQPETIKSESY